MISIADKRIIVSRILLVDGVLLIIVSFIHLLSTFPLREWLARQLTPEVLSGISAPFLLNHLIVGVLLIPFGVSTLYSAIGVRAGQRWARMIAMMNALAVLLLPIILIALIGPEYYAAAPFLVASVLITIIGFSMIVPLFWLWNDSTHRSPHEHLHQ